MLSKPIQSTLTIKKSIPCRGRVQSGRDVKMKQINDEIDDARNSRQLQDIINSLKTSADEYAFEAE